MDNASPLRRRAVLASAVGSAVAATQAQASEDRQLSWGTLAQASAELQALAAAKSRISATGWNWAQTLEHCAQSIEYSMTGFPQPKPALFQMTVGSAAFKVFEWRGRMSHDLTEPIPGAPTLAPDVQEAAALARLRLAMDNFMAWQKPLQPHFAYGALSKPQYEQAHAMHLANHLSYFRAG